jgi:hypothetical protein
MNGNQEFPWQKMTWKRYPIAASVMAVPKDRPPTPSCGGEELSVAPALPAENSLRTIELM